ncbi:uncharacterized protein LOC119078442 [Bradysia coprophila]|uniref:uncharacterized protein LOC119078442 n=1 Tax=Bradysia coprophila TaxID=38358 RepID=UPI00187D869F|nr:uncharacterized protein LOC119078442 [Bradysia coprophila]
MVAHNKIRLRLCDPNKYRLPFIKEQLRKKVPNPWYALTERELNRIRKPFESYDKELLADGYPESSKHLERLLAVRNEFGVRDTVLIDNKDLISHTMNCLRDLENCERERCSVTVAIDNLVRLASKMTKKSVGIACELYEIILDELESVECTELLKADVQFAFGKYLVDIKNFERATGILKEALKYSEERNFSDLSRRICRVYYESLYNLSLEVQVTDKELAIQLADNSKDIALTINDHKATSKSYLKRGSILMSMEKYEDAISAFKSATSELKNLPDLDLKVEILYKLSTCYFTTKDYRSCLLSLGALGRLATIYNKVEYRAHFERIDGNVKLLIGQNLTARKNFLKSIEIYEDIGLHEYAASCRYLEAVAKCEHLIKPWIALLIDGEKERSFDERFELNESKNLIFNWKVKRELFREMSDE